MGLPVHSPLPSAPPPPFFFLFLLFLKMFLEERPCLSFVEKKKEPVYLIGFEMPSGV